MAKRKEPAAADQPIAKPRRPRRSYEGAIVNRLTHGWVTSATTPRYNHIWLITQI